MYLCSTMKQYGSDMYPMGMKMQQQPRMMPPDAYSCYPQFMGSSNYMPVMYPSFKYPPPMHRPLGAPLYNPMPMNGMGVPMNSMPPPLGFMGPPPPLRYSPQFQGNLPPPPHFGYQGENVKIVNFSL